MNKIRFLRLGDPNTTLIGNLVTHLNSIQDSFFFYYEGDFIDYPRAQDPDRSIDGAALGRVVLDYKSKHGLSEYPVGICDCPLVDDLSCYIDDDSVAVITTHDRAQRFGTTSLIKVLCFVVIDIMLSSKKILLPPHYDARACPIDYWADSPATFRDSISASRFCDECLSFLRRTLSQGKISLKELVAI